MTDRASHGRYTIDARVLETMKRDALILHPLPRTVEIDKAVVEDPRALYFRQANNGLYVRMALLTMLWDHAAIGGDE
jgi:aspartate carbamoyltransferase catalytic subunit